MSTSHISLTSAADERKARLAKLASLKRKAPGSNTTVSQSQPPSQDKPPTDNPDNTIPDPPPSHPHLSGRNYDPLARAPKLGFDTSTSLTTKTPTVETHSTTLLQSTLSTAAQQEQDLKEKEQSGAGGIDLFKLQPRKPNWDLKRELDERMRNYGVEAKNKNAIARLVRQSIEVKKREALEQRRRGKGGGESKEVEEGEGEEVGIGGAEIVEAVHQREREEEEEERREREEEDGVS